MFLVKRHILASLLFTIFSFYSFLNRIIINARETPPTDQLPHSSVEEEDEDFGSLHTFHNISRWAKHEENLSSALNDRLELLRKESLLIEGYLEDYGESTGKAMENLYGPKNTTEERGDFVGSNGVLSHRMITRYTNVLDTLKELLTSSEYLDNQDKVEELVVHDLALHVDAHELYEFDESKSNLSTDIDIPETIPLPLIRPSWKDKYMSALAFMHFETTYGFLPKDMAFGATLDSKYGGQLDAFNCLEIGLFALYRLYHYKAVQWLEFAKELLTTVDDHSTSIDLVSLFLNVAIQEANHLVAESQPSQLPPSHPALVEYTSVFQELYLHPVSESIPEADRVTGRAFAYLVGKQKFSSARDRVVAQSQYIDLCRGETLQSLETQSKLFCFYERRRHPYLFINPVKAEQLSEEPSLIQYYEMIGPGTIKQVKRLGQTHLKSISTVFGPGLKFEFQTCGRTSVGARVFEPEIKNVLKLASAVTGLTLLNWSETQLAEYVYGRYYIYHADATQDNPISGDRLATILYYLDLPEVGGETPFCNAGVVGRPFPGSAILWYNMYRNGTVRLDGIHASCPVVHGHKMILNHWVKHDGNFQTYKCSLNQYE